MALTDLDVIASLPTTAKLTYLAEGAANIIYRISLPEPDSAPCATQLHGVLLRVRKQLPSSAKNEDAHRFLTSTVWPLFPKNLPIRATLIGLPQQRIDQLNQELREKLEVSRRRPAKRHGLYICSAEEEPYAFLITDMTAVPGVYELIEFKPKWLAQSPSAPKDAVFCRTCALSFLKSGRRLAGCPLDLGSADPARIRKSAMLQEGQEVEADHGIDDMSVRIRESVIKYLIRSPLIQSIKKVQMDMDPKGPLHQENLEDVNFLTAMTLRDCTIFLKVHINEPLPPDPESGISEFPVEGRIGDLDLKTSKNGKGEYWRKLEKRLANEGWYYGLAASQRGEVGCMH